MTPRSIISMRLLLLMSLIVSFVIELPLPSCESWIFWSLYAVWRNFGVNTSSSRISHIRQWTTHWVHFCVTAQFVIALDQWQCIIGEERHSTMLVEKWSRKKTRYAYLHNFARTGLSESFQDTSKLALLKLPQTLLIINEDKKKQIVWKKAVSLPCSILNIWRHLNAIFEGELTHLYDIDIWMVLWIPWPAFVFGHFEREKKTWPSATKNGKLFLINKSADKNSIVVLPLRICVSSLVCLFDRKRGEETATGMCYEYYTQSFYQPIIDDWRCEQCKLFSVSSGFAHPNHSFQIASIC